MDFRKKIASFVFGLSLPFRSAYLIVTHPILLFWSIFPVLIGLAFTIWSLTSLQAMILGWLSSVFTGWIISALWAITWVLMIFIGVFCFSIVVTVLSSPFNDFLAENTEPLGSPPLTPVLGTGFLWRTRLLALDLMKALMAAIFAVGALCVSWVPGLNIFALFLTLLLVCFQFVSYPQTRRGEGLLAGVKFLIDHFGACIGFGLMTSFLMSIPFVAAFAVPVAVVGGTLLYARAKAGLIS